MIDLEDARRRWLEDRPAYSNFGDELTQRLKHGLKKEGIWGEVSGRAKEIDSLIRKLIKKPKYTYESLGDKCGVRVIVRYKAEIEPVLEVAKSLFERGPPENKVDVLPHYEVGYLSTHADIRLYKTDPNVRAFPPERFCAELQVRSLAQHLWSEMSHDTVYKNDETLVCLPIPLKRRVFLLAGTIEVADNEFDRLNHEMPKIPEVEILTALERHYYKLTTRRADSEMSMRTIKWLYPIYGLEVPKVKARLEEFWGECATELQTVYENAERDESARSAFLFQPEALMVYDLLRHKEWNTRQAWADQNYPEKELERLANAFGISFDS
jgi:ppGpp synthetase/RelA/SpoT-type nucleotidyltranferase